MSRSPNEISRDERRAWAATWCFAILPLLGWWMYGLFDMDEGFYGAVVAEMNRRGEWITPGYNGHPWFEKPILLYWAAKPFMAVFGDAWGPRIPSILATAGVYLIVAWFVKRHWGPRAAQWSVLICASSLLVVGVGRMMMTDALLDLCLVGAFVFFWESLSRPRYRLLAALFLGLSVLAKGPVGLALFALVAGWTFAREEDLRTRFRGYWLLGTLICMATIATWYVPAYLENGQIFVQKFLIEQNLNRFTGGDLAHATPLWSYPIYYPVVLLVGMAPWSFYAWRAWRETREDPLTRYLWVWTLVPLIFFSISKAKLPHYILPGCVPLGILIGRTLSVRGRLAYPALACAIVAVIANLGFLAYYNLFHREVHDLTYYVRDHIRPDEDVAAYQMPRRQHELGTGKLKIQETSHPSIVMILDRTVREPDSMTELLADPHGQYVITRWNRIQPRDIAFARSTGRELTPVRTPTRQDLYRLYHLSASPHARGRR